MLGFGIRHVKETLNLVSVFDNWENFIKEKLGASLK